MTDEVGQLVLADNADQNDLMGTSRANAASLLPVHARQIKDLVAERGLNRELEALPSEKEIRAADRGRHRADLTGTGDVDGARQAGAQGRGAGHRPARSGGVRRRGCRATSRRSCANGSAREIRSHQLRREIVTTMLVNDLVDTGGITYAYRITEDVGVGPVDAVRTYVATDAIFGVERAVAADPGRRRRRRVGRCPTG